MGNKLPLVVICALLVAATFPAAARVAKITSGSRVQQSDKNVQAVTVKLTKEGYQPESLKLKRDVPARVTFVRETEETCGKEVVIKEYDIKRALPLNEPITVEFMPRKAGEFTFACGMDMLRGKIIVQ
jgi:plastocyanin domain-containing protein